MRSAPLLLTLLALLGGSAHAALLVAPGRHAVSTAPGRPRAASARMSGTTAGMVLISMINSEPHRITMEQTMDAVEEMCEVTPVPFSVGDVKSEAGQNMGSAKVLSFGRMLNLDEEITLHLFGSFYRDEGAHSGPSRSLARPLDSSKLLPHCGSRARAVVLEDPDGTNHPNIRAFIAGGWDAVSFPEGLALRKKG